MTTPKQLRARYPYMFEGPNIGISIPHGWMPIFESLCEDIDVLLGADKQGFHFTQCKEKFGSARWYWTVRDVEPSIRINVISEMGTVTELVRTEKLRESARRSLSARIDELVDAATSQTEQACIVCGSAGEGDRHGGWVLMLCHAHAVQRRSGRLPSLWFEGED